MCVEKPRIAWLNVNRKCNNKCTFCYAIDRLMSKDEMDIESALAMVDILKKTGVHKIIIIGGEPTLYESLVQLIKKIHDSEMVCTVQTNGLMFSDEKNLQSCIDAGMDECCISIKGFNEYDYKKTTGTDNFTKLIQAIENVKKVGFNMLYSYVVSRGTFAEAEKLVNGVDSLGIKSIFISCVHPTIGEGINYKKIDLDQFTLFFQVVHELLIEKNVIHKFSLNYPLCKFPETTIVQWLKQGILHQCTCQLVMGTGVVFDCDMKMLPCNMYVKRPFDNEQKIIKDESELFDILESEHVREIREKVRKPITKACEECFRWAQCYAGCSARWIYEKPDEVIQGFE